MRKIHAAMIGATLTAVVLAAVQVQAEGESETIALNKCPKATQAAIQAFAGNKGKVGTIEKSEEDGEAVFEAKVQKNGRNYEISVDDNGKILGTEEEVALSELPAAAAKTLKKQAESSELGKIEKVVEDGRIYFETTIKVGNKDREIEVNPDGTLRVDQEEADED